ncbi:hypothetical protein ABH944_006209 [Caballeronia udeis]|uniref:Uncharacterized protein n=1 Tax=Caballeronia udeis TaxID=1232866 RepID=A0ABW8MR15_9BURK
MKTIGSIRITGDWSAEQSAGVGIEGAPPSLTSQRPHASLAVSETLNHVIVQNRTLRAGMRIDGVAVSEPTDRDTNGRRRSTADLFAEIKIGVLKL